MKIGIIGPPQSGKTTMFKILLNKDVSGNIGVFKVMDHRIEKISESIPSKERTYPEFTFVDLGPISSFSKKDLSGLQDIDLFICVVGAFLSEDPKKDFEDLITDILISDLDLIQNRIHRLEKENKKLDRERELKVLEKCQEAISEGRLLGKVGLDMDEISLVSNLVFLSLKPLILAINLPEQKPENLENTIKPLEECCRSKGIRYIRFFGKIESELMELEPEERANFLKELGPGYSIREDLPKLISIELKIITFFTTGQKETKGWYLKSGLSVIEAAGKIHSDMKRGFIRVEVVNYEDFIKCGSTHKARELGLLKVEGKDYIVKDGDIINIRFNV